MEDEMNVQQTLRAVIQGELTAPALRQSECAAQAMSLAVTQNECAAKARRKHSPFEVA